jgi:hypothetical protein
MRFRNALGQRIRLESGARMNDDDCCCETIELSSCSDLADFFASPPDTVLITIPPATTQVCNTSQSFGSCLGTTDCGAGSGLFVATYHPEWAPNSWFYIGDAVTHCSGDTIPTVRLTLFCVASQFRVIIYTYGGFVGRNPPSGGPTDCSWGYRWEKVLSFPIDIASGTVEAAYAGLSNPPLNNCIYAGDATWAF